MQLAIPAPLRRLVEDESGATAIEYALIGAVVAIVIIASLLNFQTAIVAKYEFISATVDGAMGS